MKHHAIILASGTGARFKDDKPKQFALINGKTVIEHTIEVFENHPQIFDITVVIVPQYRAVLEKILAASNYKKVKRVLDGGATRKESSFIGVSSVEDGCVLIHDCARPCLSPRIIDDCVEALKTHDAVNVAVQSTDTIIEVDKNNFAVGVPPRKTLRRVQTPQCFKTSLIQKAHAKQTGDFTDDCSLVMKYAPVFVVEGDENNIKITYPQDLYLAGRILS